MTSKILIACVLVFSFNSCKVNQQGNITNTFEFKIGIISGSLLGKGYKGSFSYSTVGIKNQGEERIKVNKLHFEYQGKMFDENGFDARPEVVLVDGKFSDLVMVGGSQTMRFGLNAGFERSQFGREEESFIGEGKSYFGYLDENTYVDGAGKVEYKKVK